MCVSLLGRMHVKCIRDYSTSPLTPPFGLYSARAQCAGAP
jgi:hypothetical protein